MQPKTPTLNDLKRYLEQLDAPADVPPADDSAARRPSEKQRAANRANAQKSTGPRTEQGKAVSRLNALRHGLRASDAVLVATASDEERESYQTLLLRLFDELKPVGIHEELLVERLGMLYFRQLRVYRAETDTMAARAAERGYERWGLSWLPDALEDVIRYDVQAERSMLRVLRELRRCQVHRLRAAATPPATPTQE